MSARGHAAVATPPALETKLMWLRCTSGQRCEAGRCLRCAGTICGSCARAPARLRGTARLQTPDRRGALQRAAALSLLAAGLAPAVHAQITTDALAAKSMAEALAALGGKPAPSSAITLDVPTVADDGAGVPVSFASALPGTREMLLLVDVNPQPVVLRFVVPEGTEAFLATRIRMAASGTVLAAVRTGDGTLHAAARKVQVSLSGCA